MSNNMINWSDQLGPRKRRAWALIIGPGDEIEVFQGKPIPGKVAVLGYDYEKAGIWSHTTYRLQIAENVRFLTGRFGWGTNTFREGLRDATGKETDRWYQVANALGVTLPTAMKLVREFAPNEAKELDQVEDDLASLDDNSPAGATTISLSYGWPTRKEREQGFWEWPVRILDRNGREVGRVSADGTPSGQVRILKREFLDGHGGGGVSLLLAVPEGCEAVHGPVPGEKTQAEMETENSLREAAAEWLQQYGQPAVHVACREYSFGRQRILTYAEQQGCPIPSEYAGTAEDLNQFLAEAAALSETFEKLLK